MKKNLFIVVFMLLTVQIHGQSIALKEVIKQGQICYAVLDTTGIIAPDEVNALSAELKKINNVKEVILACGKDCSSTGLKAKLNAQNIILAGLFVKDNSVWKALSGGVYAISKQRAGSFPPNIGLKAIGDNPAGEGMSVVFTSNSFSGLKNILSFGQADKSFYAVINGQVVESLNLNRKFILDDASDKSAERVPLDKVLEDMNYYFNTVQSVHPQLLKNITADEYLKMKKFIADTLTQLDKKNDLTAADLSILLSEASARFKDAHTNLMPMIKEFAPLRMPPFRFKYSNGKLLTGSTVKDLEEYSGCEIIKINQMKPEEFLKPALALVSAESRNFRLMRFTGDQGKYLAAKNIFNLSSFSLTVKKPSGGISEVKLNPVTFNDFLSLKESEDIVNESYFEFLNNGAAAYFQYNQFVVSDQAKALIDSLFKMIEKNKSKDLIIDLRFNGGGNSSMGDYILSYITSKPYSMVSRMDVKISKELLKRGGYTDYRELEGMLISYSDIMTTPEDRGHKFTGRVTLLISSDTFSSACMLTGVIKDYRLGTIIGYETGGVRQSFGDIMSFSTPKLNIPFGVSYKVFYAPVPQPGDEMHGTMPDIEITDELLKSYAGSKDPALEYALNYISKQSL